MRVRHEQASTSIPNPHPNPSPEGRGAERRVRTSACLAALCLHLRQRLDGIPAAAFGQWTLSRRSKRRAVPHSGRSELGRTHQSESHRLTCLSRRSPGQGFQRIVHLCRQSGRVLRRRFGAVGAAARWVGSRRRCAAVYKKCFGRNLEWRPEFLQPRCGFFLAQRRVFCLGRAIRRRGGRARHGRDAHANVSRLRPGQCRRLVS